MKTPLEILKHCLKLNTQPCIDCDKRDDTHSVLTCRSLLNEVVVDYENALKRAINAETKLKELENKIKNYTTEFAKITMQLKEKDNDKIL